MADLQTRPTDGSIEDFINSVPDEQKRKDSRVVLNMMADATNEKPVMWGPAIIGFGSQHLKYASGRELDWPIMGFSPRKQNLTLYVLDYQGSANKLLARLGKHSIGKSCLYIKRLSDIDINVLKQIIKLASKSVSQA